jgi:alpha-1,2-mannosyltransferase
MSRHVRTLLVVVAGVVGVVLLLNSIPRLSGALGYFPWDLVTDYRLGRAFLDGFNPYTPAGRVRADLAFGVSATGHPPTSMLPLLPLIAAVDLPTAHVVMGWLSAFLLLVEFSVLAPTLRVPVPGAAAFLGFAWVTALPLFYDHFLVGQLSMSIAFLLFGAWLAARRGDDVLAGVALGVACMLKLFPGLMVLLFLLWRRWRLVGTAVGLYLAGVLVTMVRFGPSSWWLFVTNQGPIANEFVGHIQNQALFGVVTRLFRPSCRPEGGGMPVAAAAISSLLGLALIAAGAWRARRARTEGQQDLAFATFSVLALVTPQWTWEHYDVIYILPIAIGLAALVAAWRNGASRPWVAAGVALLLAAAASWALNDSEKADLQKAIRAGDRARHLALHLYEVINWLPGFVILGVLGTLFWRATAQGRIGEGAQSPDTP